MIVKQWPIEERGGSHIFLLSSLDSEDLYREFSNVIGDDVIATLAVNYWKFEPTLNG